VHKSVCGISRYSLVSVRPSVRGTDGLIFVTRVRLHCSLVIVPVLLYWRRGYDRRCKHQRDECVSSGAWAVSHAELTAFFFCRPTLLLTVYLL
jgi:hypothetical protein